MTGLQWKTVFITMAKYGMSMCTPGADPRTDLFLD